MFGVFNFNHPVPERRPEDEAVRPAPDGRRPAIDIEPEITETATFALG